MMTDSAFVNFGEKIMCFQDHEIFFFQVSPQVMAPVPVGIKTLRISLGCRFLKAEGPTQNIF